MAPPGEAAWPPAGPITTSSLKLLVSYLVIAIRKVIMKNEIGKVRMFRVSHQDMNLHELPHLHTYRISQKRTKGTQGSLP